MSLCGKWSEPDGHWRKDSLRLAPGVSVFGRRWGDERTLWRFVHGRIPRERKWGPPGGLCVILRQPEPTSALPPAMLRGPFLRQPGSSCRSLL